MDTHTWNRDQCLPPDGVPTEMDGLSALSCPHFLECCEQAPASPAPVPGKPLPRHVPHPTVLLGHPPKDVC